MNAVIHFAGVRIPGAVLCVAWWYGMRGVLASLRDLHH